VLLLVALKMLEAHLVVIATHQLPYARTRAMPRHLFIVSRKFPDLYEYLTERFIDDKNAAVILDRRWGQRRRGPHEFRSLGANRRFGDRRFRTDLDEELRTQPHVVVTLP